MNFSGRHYETGTLTNFLEACGVTNPFTKGPISEALVLGASGGIAFGNFVFQYKGYLPHAAILTRNTFDPFERALDGLAIIREVRETTNPAKGEENLIRSLDEETPAIVWVDALMLPPISARREDMWMMRPLLITRYDQEHFYYVNRGTGEQPMDRQLLSEARGRVKKDRYRLMTLQKLESEALPGRLLVALQSSISLYFDKPPAGAATNFGSAGLAHWAKLLTDPKNPKGWQQIFTPGPNFAQAVVGQLHQPAVFDWIETWGTGPGADRSTFADFLIEAGQILGKSLDEEAAQFRGAATKWTALAEASLPDQVQNGKVIKQKKRELWRLPALGTPEVLQLRQELRSAFEEMSDASVLSNMEPKIFEEMAQLAVEIRSIEDATFGSLRGKLAEIG